MLMLTGTEIFSLILICLFSILAKIKSHIFRHTASYPTCIELRGTSKYEVAVMSSIPTNEISSGILYPISLAYFIAPYAIWS